MDLISFLQSNCVNFDKNIYFFSGPQESSFSQLYLSLREKEHRLYENPVVKNLPVYTGSDDQLVHEWQLRKISSERLKEYILSFFPNASILEVGCGNGWLCNFLKCESDKIFGLDVNLRELQQAGELFHVENVEFIYGNLFEIEFPKNSFDLIIFASSIQYFEDIRALITFCRGLLTTNGEIHILDSHIYKKNTVQSAIDRSNDYYKKIGFPEMSNYYFHHSEEEFEPFNPIMMYDPDSAKSKFIGKFNKNSSVPFPWIKILKT